MNFLDIIIFCTLIVIYGIAVILLSGGNTSMRKMFLSEVQTELDKSKVTNEVFTEEDISNLPEPVQRYFRYCGYIGKEKMTNAKFVWDDVNFKMSPDKPWFKIKYEQYNFVSEPSRFAYIYSKMFGVIPFEGRDKFLDGKGNMIGRLAKIKTVFDVTGAEMDVSAAVTYLSESLIVPACALQKYIRWEAIDQNYAKASIEYIGTKAEGIFTFNDKGEFTKFETDERYMDIGNGKTEKHRWTAVVDSYIEKNDIKIPSKMRAIWNLPEGDYEYFNGSITDIMYNNKLKIKHQNRV
jgi:hypothetical protein